MRQETTEGLVGCALVVALSLVMLAVAAGIWIALTAGLQWGIAGVFGQHVPFWPLFALVVCVSIIAQGVTHRRKEEA